MNLSTLLVLVFLVGMWVALLAGPVLQNRGTGARGGRDSIKSFQRQLAVLDRNGGARTPLVRPLGGTSTSRRQPVVANPMRPSQYRARQAAMRRRRIVTILAGASVTSFVLWMTLGWVFGYMLIGSLVLFISYLALMFQVLQSQAEREMKVAFLPHRDAGAEPTMLLQLREAAQGRR